MSNSLIVVASAQGGEGVSAKLAQHYADIARANGNQCDWRILADTPPPPLNAQFVAAAFAPKEHRDTDMQNALAYSDREIAALRKADTLVLAIPMYNFGMPGLLKSWFDQIIRPGETFETTGNSETPYRGLLSCSRCIAITVRGSEAFSPSGMAPELNFLDPHLEAMLHLVGIDSIDIVDCAGVDENPTAREALLARTLEQIGALATVHRSDE
jgi:FMN-dependent NADH-azoreductase